MGIPTPELLNRIDELINLLAKAILDGHVHRDSVIKLTIRDGQIAFL